MTRFLPVDAILRVANQVHAAGGPPAPAISGPRDPFIQKVRHHVSFAYTAWACLPDWTSNSRSRRRFDALHQVQRLAQRLQALVEDDDMPLDSHLGRHMRFPETVSGIVEGIAKLAAAATAERSRLEAAGLDAEAPLAGLEGPNPTPGSEFIRHMAKAYREAFGIAPAIQYDSDREPRGPFVVFVLACMSEVAAAEIEAGVADPEQPVADSAGAVAQAYLRWQRVTPSDKDQ